MTDRELLELAARAAGEWPSPEPFEHVLCRWNPLTDDGDALRLAVTLRMSVSIFDNSVGVGIRGAFGYREYDLGSDVFSSVRSAIVCAAAEKGKEIK